MAIPIKSPRDLEEMRRAGAVLWEILGRAVAGVSPGITTAEIDRRIAADIAAAGAEPLGQEVGFPAAASVCINEEAVHGVPGPRIVRAGDVVTIDAALRLGGWCVDAARAVLVGKGSEEARRLVAAARGAVEAAIAAMRPGRRWSEVAAEAARVARGAGCAVVAEYAGHGIGRELHEPPACPFARNPAESGGQRPSPGQDFILRPGMTLTIEPVLTLGGPAVLGLDDGWTVATADRSWAAHEERTAAVVRRGSEVLTGPA
jgi:methionyl aminopeptidase